MLLASGKMSEQRTVTAVFWWDRMTVPGSVAPWTYELIQWWILWSLWLHVPRTVWSSTNRLSLSQVFIDTKCQHVGLLCLIKNLTYKCLRGELGAEPRALTGWIPKEWGWPLRVSIGFWDNFLLSVWISRRPLFFEAIGIIDRKFICLSFLLSRIVSWKGFAGGVQITHAAVCPPSSEMERPLVGVAGLVRTCGLPPRTAGLSAGWSG